MNCTVSLSLLYSWQEAKSRFLSSQLNPGHGHATSSTAPSHDTRGRVYPSKHSLQNDGRTLQTHPSTFPPSTSCLPAPPYHLLGFGSFTAESTGLSSGQVLGEMAVEHPEAARVHLANGHFCLVPWAERNGLPRKHVQKSLASLASHSNPQRVPRVLCLQGSTVSSLLCTPVRQVIQESPQCILSICCVGHSENGMRDKQRERLHGPKGCPQAHGHGEVGFVGPGESCVLHSWGWRGSLNTQVQR